MSHTSGKDLVIDCGPYVNLDNFPQQPRNNKLTHCYSSKFFWFAICHCILFLLLILITLTLCNQFGFTPAILKVVRNLRISGSEEEADKECSTGYMYFEETNSCYKATPFPTLFEDAESSCEDDGAHLTSIHSEIENLFISGLYHDIDVEHSPQRTKWNYWIGLIRPNSTWKWLDGTPFAFKNWYSSEGILDTNNQWSSIHSGIKWRRVSGEKRGFVCKKPSSRIAKPPKYLATTPCSNGYTYFRSTGSCYKVHLTKKSFDNATKACRDEASHLVSIHSETENCLVRGLVLQAREKNNQDHLNVWIGLSHKNNKFIWSDGSLFDYETLAPAVPNDFDGKNKTVVGDKEENLADESLQMTFWRLWDNAKPSDEFGFICKKY